MPSLLVLAATETERVIATRATGATFWVTAAAMAIGLCWFTYLSLRSSESPWPRRVLLAALRTAAIVLLAWMGLRWERQATPVDRPWLTILVDVSQSMQTADESPAVGQTTPRTRWEAVRSTWLTEDSAAVRELSARYQVRIATTDASGVAVHELRNRTNFTAASPLGDALLSAADDSPGEPPTAVVFLTDGNVTAGASLSSAAERLRQRLIPVFVGGVGSATGPRDIALDDVLLEDDAYVGDLVAAHVRLSVRGAEGPVAVELRDETTGEVLAKAAVAVAAADRAVPLRRGEGVLRFRPPAAGALTLRIAAEPLANELRLENNRRQRTLHVHPARLRVLLAWGTPSYEFRYLKALLERELRSAAATTDADDNSSLLHVYLHDADPEHAEQDRSALRSFPTAEELNRYDVIICGDLPPSAVRPETLAAIRAWVEDQGRGLVLIAGPRSGWQAWADTPLAACLPCLPQGPSSTAIAAPWEQSWSWRLTPTGRAATFLTLADDEAASDLAWSQLPPLYWHAALPTVKPGTRVLAEIVDENNARHPVATLGFVGSGRVLFHATDETHRWRFRSGDTYFGRYWLQTLRQLAKGTAAAGAELTTDNPDYAFGEPTTLRLRFRDVRQAPRDDRGVEIELARSGFAAERILLPRDAVGQGLFATQIRDLPPGEYHAHWPGPTPESSRDVRFVVHPPAAETDPQPQNVHELERLAHITGGAYRPQGEWQELLQRLPTATLRPIGNDRRTPLWNAAWVAALFVGLLSLEWWLRYRWGMY